MGKLLSLSVSITTIVVLFTGGLTIMIIPVNNILTTQWNLITFALWGIAFIWLIAMIVYRGQKVNVDILSCELSPKSKDEFIIAIEGFIHSRHPDGLRDIKLWLHPALGFSSMNALSNVPHSVDSKPQMFRVGYSVTHEFVKHAMEEQQTDGTNIAWMLSADMRNADWLCFGGIIAPSFLEEGKLERLATEGKMTRNTEKRKVGQLGINKKQFHNLLANASQPIKKSEMS